MLTYPRRLAMAAGVALLASTSALAAMDASGIKEMKDGSLVTITGTVEKVQNAREFKLRDANGATIGVDIASDQSVVLKKGDAVTVSGVVDDGLFGTDINASDVRIQKSVIAELGDAIEANTNISFEGATAYSINALPSKGLVKISGVVTDVDNEKEFTLRDASGGEVDIDVASSDRAVFAKGAEVTVIGYVDSDLGGKDINAYKIIVKSNTAPVASY